MNGKFCPSLFYFGMIILCLLFFSHARAQNLSPVWKLGKQSLIGLGGEPVIEYAIKLKRHYGRDLFVFGYTNDVMAYIPTRQVLMEGGYEGATSQMAFGLPATWKPNIETIIFTEINNMMADLEK